MTTGIDIATVAALVGDPGRANMLAAMLDGRAHTASELALLAGVTAQTASGHLGKLRHASLISVAAQGRHRYYCLASAEVARMLEGIMAVAAQTASGAQRATPRIDPALRRARTCYDHMAGELGVTLADALVGRGFIELSVEGANVTPLGKSFLPSLGVPPHAPQHGRRAYCRSCLDWSERRPHLAGFLGAALLERALTSGLVRRRDDSRALDVDATRAQDVLHSLQLG